MILVSDDFVQYLISACFSANSLVKRVRWGDFQSHCIGHLVEYRVDLLLGQLAEKGLSDSGDSNFDLIRPEVARHDRGKSLDSRLNGLLGVPLSIVLLVCSLQLSGRLLFL